MIEALIIVYSPILGLLLFALLVNFAIKRMKALQDDDTTGKTNN